MSRVQRVGGEASQVIGVARSEVAHGRRPNGPRVTASRRKREVVHAWPTVVMRGNTHVTQGTFLPGSPEKSALVRTQARHVKLLGSSFGREAVDSKEAASNA